MRNRIVGLVLVVGMLVLLLGFVSWSDAFVVQGEGIGLKSFSVVSPLVIGMLIMGVVALMIIVIGGV